MMIYRLPFMKPPPVAAQRRAAVERYFEAIQRGAFAAPEWRRDLVELETAPA